MKSLLGVCLAAVATGYALLIVSAFLRSQTLTEIAMAIEIAGGALGVIAGIFAGPTRNGN